jgi:hypothetical protein
MERPYLNRGGRLYVQRTYVANGQTSVYVYNRYSYRGVVYDNYVPVSYYHPGFYTWAVSLWASPVPWAWAWYGDPWYTPYSYYFAPSTYYPGPSLWLTDYLLAQTLQADYQARVDSNSGQGNFSPPQPPPAYPPAEQPVAQNPTGVTPEVKQEIADQVRQQLDAEKAAAVNPQPTPAQGPPPALDPGIRVFIVSSSIDVSAGSDQCSLTADDIITRIDDTPDENQNVSALVTTSKRADCPSGEKVTVAVQSLQEMYNQYRARTDSGLKVLAQSQGTRGMPAAPDTRTAPGEVPPPAPDAIQADLRTQQAEALQVESGVKQQVGAGGQR